jgi:hypothetical protein
MPSISLITLSLLAITTLSSALNFAPEDRFHLVKRSSVPVQQRDIGDLKLLQVKMVKRQTASAAGPGGAMVVTGGVNPPINPADTVQVADVIPASGNANGDITSLPQKRNKVVRRSTRRDVVNSVPVHLATRGLADGTIEVIELDERSLSDDQQEQDLVERDSFQGEFEERELA